MKVIKFNFGKLITQATDEILEVVDKYEFTNGEVKMLFQSLVNTVEVHLLQLPDEHDEPFYSKQYKEEF